MHEYTKKTATIHQDRKTTNIQQYTNTRIQGYKTTRPQDYKHASTQCYNVTRIKEENNGIV